MELLHKSFSQTNRWNIYNIKARGVPMCTQMHMCIHLDAESIGLILRAPFSNFECLKTIFSRKYFNIVDLCGILPYKRMYPHLCGRIIYNCISSPFLYYNQYAWVQISFVMARVSVFSRLMSAISISQWKWKRLSNIDHVLGSYAVKLPNNYSSSWRCIHRQASITEMLLIP